MTKSREINLSIIGFLAVFILIFVFMVYPLSKNIKNSSQELVSQKKELADLELKIVNLEKFKILYKNFEEILKKIDNLFVSQELPVDFIAFLENTSDEFSLKTEISPSAAKKIGGDPWSSFVFQLSSGGSFNNLVKFIKKLENSSYLIEVQNVNISRVAAEKNAPSDIRAVFSIKVFVR